MKAFALLILMFASYAFYFAIACKFPNVRCMPLKSGFMYVNEVNGSDSEVIAYPLNKFKITPISEDANKD